MSCTGSLFYLFQILTTEIKPTLEHLQRQQQQYIQWLESKRDYERLEKFRIAYHFVAAHRTLVESEKEIKDLMQRVRSSFEVIIFIYPFLLIIKL